MAIGESYSGNDIELAEVPKGDVNTSMSDNEGTKTSGYSALTF
jgi:hypothetical protein